MNCPNCQANLSDQAQFCNHCGMQLQQPAMHPRPKKKKPVALIIVLSVLVVLLGVIVWFVGSLMWFGPRNLGVSYTPEDFESAMAKTGLTIQMDGQTQAVFDDLKENNEKGNIDDFTFTFSDYTQKTFSLSPSEATALLNEIAPAFWWFDDLQVDVLDDGTMVGSSTADIGRLKKDLYADVADTIPIPLPNRVNIYSKGNILIDNNRLSGDPESFYIGPIPLPERYMDRSSIQTMETYFERIYRVIPQMQIYELDARNGEFVFDGYIPQTVTVEAK